MLCVVCCVAEGFIISFVITILVCGVRLVLVCAGLCMRCVER